MIRIWSFQNLVRLTVLIFLGCVSLSAQSGEKTIDYGQELSENDCVSIAEQFVKKLFTESAKFRHTKCAEDTWNSVPSKNMEVAYGWELQGEINATNQKGEYLGFRKFQVLINNNRVVRYCIYNSKGLCNPRLPPDCTHANDKESTSPIKVVNRFMANLENGDFKSLYSLFACPVVFRHTTNVYGLGELKSISNDIIAGKTKFQVICGKSMSSVAVVIVNQNIKNGKPSGDPDPLFLVLENKSWRILPYKRIEKDEYAYFTPTQKKEYSTLFNSNRNNLRNMLSGGNKSVCDQ